MYPVTAPAVTFEVFNGRTNVHGAPPNLLDALESRLAYPSALADAEEDDWKAPGDCGGWDGWVRLLRRPMTIPPWFPTGLLEMTSRLCASWGWHVNYLDLRQRPADEIPEFADLELRDYQTEAVRVGVEVGRGVFDMPPRSGKTRLAVELQRQLNHPCLWIAPTDRIVRQTRRVIEQYMGKHYAVHAEGTKKCTPEELASARVVVCTAATAVRLPQEFYDTRHMMIVDEWHHGAAKTYRDIFKKADHIFYRFGMTGTFFRSGEDDLAMHALLSQTLYKVTTLELLERGFLVPTRVLFLPVLDAERLPSQMGSFNVGHGKLGIHECIPRNVLAARCAMHLWQRGKKVLMLVGTKVQGRTLLGYIQSMLPPKNGTEFHRAEFVSTDTARPVTERIIDAFVETDEVGILLGTSLVGEGVDLPSADALVYARGERAEVTLTQSAFRVCTAKAGKSEALIVDFADRHQKKLMEHSKERLRVYYEEPTFSVDVMQGPEQFFAAV